MDKLVIPIDKKLISVVNSEGKELFSEEPTILSCIFYEVERKNPKTSEDKYKMIKEVLENKYDCKDALDYSAIYRIYIAVNDEMELLKKSISS